MDCRRRVRGKGSCVKRRDVSCLSVSVDKRASHAIKKVKVKHTVETQVRYITLIPIPARLVGIYTNQSSFVSFTGCPPYGKSSLALPVSGL